jgi:hypothetical protein
VLVDTNFINFSIQNKIELVQGMMDCLMAKCECGAGDARGQWAGVILAAWIKHCL